MPKPCFLPRSSELYVRFRVPTDLRSAVGSRFIVRSLRGLRGDAARLSAACLAVALSEAFDALRKGMGMVDFKKLLDSAQQAADSGSLRDWTASGVKVGGVDFGTVTTSGSQDTLDFINTMQAAAGIAVPARTQTPTRPVPQVVAPVSDAPLLSVEIANHIADLERRQLAADTITESKHSLRLLLGIVGDVPVDQIKTPQIRKFWDGVRWWPAKASVVRRYRGLSVPEIIEKGREDDVPMPSPHTMNKHRQRLSKFFVCLIDADLIVKSPLKGTGPEIDTSTDLDTGRPFTDFELGQIFDPLRPIAQPLLDAGFLDFVQDMRATGHPRLFPHLPAGTKKNSKPNGAGYGRQLSRQFSVYVRGFGVEKGVAFHAFRHTLSTALAEAFFPTTTITLITEHARKQEVPVLETHYIHIADVKSLPERVAALAKFKPPVALTNYKSGQFSEALADREALHP